MNSMPIAKVRSWSPSLLLLEGSDPMDQIGVLDANVGHVQRDVTEIKNDQRRAGDKLDDMNGRLDMLRDKIDKVGGDANQRIDALGVNVSEARTDITEKLDSTSKELSGEMKGFGVEMNGMRKEFGLEAITMRKDLGLEISQVRKEVTAEVTGVRSDLSHLRNEIAAVKLSVAAARVSTLKLQLTIAAGLLGVMAHGFKWI